MRRAFYLFSFLVVWNCIQVRGQTGALIPSGAKEALTQRCNTANVKVVFICKDTMYFVDFSESTPHIQKMNKVTSAYFPVISSDGKWITYQTGIEAEGPYSGVKVGVPWVRECAQEGTPAKIADTGYVPRFVQNTAADSPEIVYATSVACPNGTCYAAGRTLKKKIVNKTPGVAQVVWDKGSYYGGLSWEGRYLITGWPGGPNVFMLDTRDTSATPHAVHTMRVKKNNTDVDTFVAVGACNISRSASSLFTNTMLFYDFSSAAIQNAGCHHPLLGTWAEHAKLFISRFDAEDLKVFDMPADRTLVPSADAQGNGEAVGKEWYNPEWSNHPYFAAASLLVDRLFKTSSGWDHTFNCESIYLVDLKDSVYVKLIASTDSSYTSTTNFAYPFVWVETPASFQEDTTWLKYTIWERAGQGIRYREKDKKLFGEGDGFFKSRDIASASLYSLQGGKIASLRNSGNLKRSLDRACRYLRCGGYILELETRDAHKAFIPYTLMR